MSIDAISAARPLRVGLVGLNNHGQTILRAIRESGNLELVSCFDIDGRACELAAEAYGIRIAASYDAMLEDPELEAVALVTPNDLHATQAVSAFGHDKHVFIEKPIANTARDAQAILDAAARAGRTLMVGHNTRRRGVFRAAKECIEQGALGAVIAAEANLSRHVGLESAMPAWKADPTRCVLLPMSQLGVHFIDVARYLFGPLLDASAIAENRAMPDGTIDAVSAIIRTETGIPLSINSYYSTLETYVFRIFGSDAVMSCGPVSAQLEHLDPTRSRHWDFSSEGYESFILQMREFGRCCADGTHPETDGATALDALAVVLAMEASASSGRRVMIGEYRR